MIRLWTDGCCLKNPGGAGGWAFVIEQRGHVIGWRSGGSLKTTNNRMEMTAALVALRWAAEAGPGRVQLCSDSKYVVEGMNAWRFKWRVIGWRKKPTSTRKVRNADLWEALDEAAGALAGRIDFRWVKGHSGANFNEQADGLADQAAREAGKAAEPVAQLGVVAPE